jgi:hypothetical protein
MQVVILRTQLTVYGSREAASFAILANPTDPVKMGKAWEVKYSLHLAVLFAAAYPDIASEV